MQLQSCLNDWTWPFPAFCTGCLKKSELYQIEHLQIGFPPAMGSVSLEIVFGRFLQFLNRIKRFKVIFIGNFSQQHPILFMIFGLEMVP